MKWQVGRRSSNVEDRRGMGVGGMGGLGLGGILLVVVVSMLLGKNPVEVLGQVSDQGAAQTQGNAAPANDEAKQFVSSVLGSTDAEIVTVMRTGRFSSSGRPSPAGARGFSSAAP